MVYIPFCKDGDFPHPDERLVPDGPVGFDEVVVSAVVVDIVEVIEVDGEQAPGRHCEYHEFWYVQQLPASQVVGPVQPMPPPFWHLLTRFRITIHQEDAYVH